MKKSSLLIGLALAVALTGCVNRQAQKQSAQTEKMLANPTVAVEVQPASVQSISKTIEVTGSIVAADDAQVGAKIGGKITAVFVRDGDEVQPGEVLATLDSSAQRAQYDQAVSQEMAARSALAQAQYNQKYGPLKSIAALHQAQSQLNSAQENLKKLLAGARPEERRQADANLAAAKVNLATAESNLRRIQSLVDQGALAKNQLDSAKNSYSAAMQQYQNALQAVLINRNGARPEDIQVARDAVKQAQDQVASAKAQKSLDVLYAEQVASARAQLQSAMAQVAQAQISLGDATVRAPFKGHVSGKPLQIGTVVAAGTSIVHLVGISGSYFDGQVPENYINEIKVGMPVTVSINALGSQTLAGHVAAINPVGGNVARLFSVRVQVDGNIPGMLPNMFATASLPVKTASNAVLVPTDAIVTVNGKQGIFTVQDGKAHMIPITEGISNSHEVQAIGLPANTPVIVKGQLNVSEGIPVQAAAKGQESINVGA